METATITPTEVELLQANDSLLGQLGSIVNSIGAEFQVARQLHEQLGHGGGRRFVPAQLHQLLQRVTADLAAAREKVHGANRAMNLSLQAVAARQEQMREQALSIDLPAFIGSP